MLNIGPQSFLLVLIRLNVNKPASLFRLFQPFPFFVLFFFQWLVLANFVLHNTAPGQ